LDVGGSHAKAIFDNREELLLASTSNGSLNVWDLSSQQGLFSVIYLFC
jgi:hypothetical protein